MLSRILSAIFGCFWNFYRILVAEVTPFTTFCVADKIENLLTENLSKIPWYTIGFGLER